MKNKSLFFITLFFAVSLYNFTSCNNVTNVTTSSLTNKDGEWSDWDDWNDWDAGFVEDYEEFIPSFDYLSTMKVEAENTKYSLCRVSEGGSGKVLDWTSDDTLVKFNIEAEEEKVVEIFLQLAVDFSENRSRNYNERLELILNEQSIYLNGQFTQTIEGDWWLQYYSISLGETTLLEGENSLVLRLTDSVNLDYIEISDSNSPTFNYSGDSSLIIQGEETNCSECKISDGGSGKVLDWTTDNTKVRFIINANSDCLVNLSVNIAVDFSENRSRNINERLSLLVNGKLIVLNGEFDHDNLEEWWFNYILLSLGEIQLSSGKNILELKLSDSVNLDYLQIDL